MNAVHSFVSYAELSPLCHWQIVVTNQITTRYGRPKSYMAAIVNNSDIPGSDIFIIFHILLHLVYHISIFMFVVLYVEDSACNLVHLCCHNFYCNYLQCVCVYVPN